MEIHIFENTDRIVCLMLHVEFVLSRFQIMGIKKATITFFSTLPSRTVGVKHPKSISCFLLLLDQPHRFESRNSVLGIECWSTKGSRGSLQRHYLTVTLIG